MFFRDYILCFFWNTEEDCLVEERHCGIEKGNWQACPLSLVREERECQSAEDCIKGRSVPHLNLERWCCLHDSDFGELRKILVCFLSCIFRGLMEIWKLIKE